MIQKYTSGSNGGSYKLSKDIKKNLHTHTHTKKRLHKWRGITMFMDRTIEYHKMLVFPKLDPTGIKCVSEQNPKKSPSYYPSKPNLKFVQKMS